MKVSWPCGQNSQPSSTATNGVTCATRREARVTGFDCGVGVVLLPALAHRLGGRVSISSNPGAVLASRDRMTSHQLILNSDDRGA